MKKPRTTPVKELTQGFLASLKASNSTVGVWAIRGKVFARVMVAARDARLSGGEYSVLLTIALHLQHLGRSKGMMTMATLADDCMVTERTVRNALRTLRAAKFVSSTVRANGQIVLLLDPRFGPKAVVPADKSVDKSPRRSAARKKISKKSPPVGFSHSSVVESLYRPPNGSNNSTRSAVAPRRESHGIYRDSRTAQRPNGASTDKRGELVGPAPPSG